MDMQERILKLQEVAKNRNVSWDEIDAIRQSAAIENHKKQQADRVDALLKQIPLRFRNKSFDDYLTDNDQQAMIKIIAKRYVETFAERKEAGTCIKMIGKPGTGKTFLSLLIFQGLVNAGYTAHYESSLNFIHDMQSKRIADHQKFDSDFRLLTEADLLVLDEVTESINKGGIPSEAEKAMLFRIIDQRYLNKRCTVVITNRDHDGLVERIGLQTVDRLSQDCISMAFDWPSYRTNKLINE